MLDSVEGRVARVSEDSVVLDCGSFALRLKVPLSALSELRPGEKARLYTHLTLRDDAFHLFGFVRELDREFFDVLLGVGGLGPEKARALLSALPVEGIAQAARAKDPKRFRTVRGIGQKLAERLVLELHDKVDRFADGAATREPRPSAVEDVVATLQQLGYPRATAEAAADAAVVNRGPGAALEDLIKQALRSLQRPAADSARPETS